MARRPESVDDGDPGEGHAYFALDFDDEVGRRRAMAQRHDKVTRRRARELGLSAGWSCLEVGAGAGTVACWFAGEVGPTGRVVATDIDLSGCDAADHPTVELRLHDIVADDLEEGTFDLVHARAVVIHLPGPQSVIDKLARALKPGGWLLVEDLDNVSSIAVTVDHPLARGFDELMHRIKGHLRDAGVFDPYIGRRLPRMLEAAGLVDGDNDCVTRINTGGDLGSQIVAWTDVRLRERLILDGIATAEELDRRRSAMFDPTFQFMDSLLVAAWARRPVD